MARGTITAYFGNSSTEDRGRDGEQPPFKSVQGRIPATIRLLIPLDMLGSIDRGKQSCHG